MAQKQDALSLCVEMVQTDVRPRDARPGWTTLIEKLNAKVAKELAKLREEAANGRMEQGQCFAELTKHVAEQLHGVRVAPGP